MVLSGIIEYVDDVNCMDAGYIADKSMQTTPLARMYWPIDWYIKFYSSLANRLDKFDILVRHKTINENELFITPSILSVSNSSLFLCFR